MLAVVVSRADPASEHVGEHLLDLAEWEEHSDGSLPDGEGGGTVYRADGIELRSFDDLHLHLDGVADAFDGPEGSAAPSAGPDLLAFASRHAGETGPLLTAHHTGNFGPAEYGGGDGSLARAAPNALRAALSSFREHAPPAYDVGVEATHHGPSDVGVPSLFVEVGSDEPQWADPDAARAVARTILDLRSVAPDASAEALPADLDGPDATGVAPATSRGSGGVRRHLVGFGGGHYVPRYERVLRETDWRVGHVAADWALEAMGDHRENEAVIERAFECSDATYALLEAERPALRETIESLGHRVVGETWVRETSGVPLGLVARLEAAIGTVDEGLRLGEPARDHEGEFAVVAVDPDLLAETRGIDREATRAAVADVALAFDTEQSGTAVVGPVAVADPDDGEGIVEALAGLLEREYDAVERAGDELVARTTTFDPALAREAGVPEGPKFGRLSAGESIEVDGRTVHPGDVTSERERRFDARVDPE